MVDKQFEFTIDLGRLLLYVANQLSIEAARAGDKVQITMGDVYEDQTRPESCWVHMPGSLHSLRLAADVNLFVNGEYITGRNQYFSRMGDFWENLRPGENFWGGRFGDYNHFSRGHEGKK